MSDIRANDLPEKTTAAVPLDTVIAVDSEDGYKVKQMASELFK